METNNDNNFTIEMDFSGREVEANIIPLLINNDKTVVYQVLVDNKKIAELEMDLSKTQWKSNYGSLDPETIQDLGAKIEDYFD